MQLAAQLRLGLADAVEQIGLFLGQPERPALVRQGVDDRLAHPPDGVGDELDALVGVEALGRLDQPDVALVDQVEEGQAAAAVALGVGDHEAQVGLDELLERRLVTLADLAAEDFLLFGRDPVQSRNFFEIFLERFGTRACRFFAFFLSPHRGAPAAEYSTAFAAFRVRRTRP